MNSSTNKRLIFTGYLVITAAVLLILRLYFLQVMSGEDYAKAASENITRTRTTAAPRGNIYDRNGKLLVESVPTTAVAVDPFEVLKRDDVLSTLSKRLGISYYDLKDKLEKTKTTYIDRIIIKQNIDKETLVYLKEHSQDLPGVEVVNIFLRKYNFGSLAAHVLGYTGEIDEEKLKQEKNQSEYEGGDQIGLTGVEEQYEDILRGIKGKIVYEVDPLGRPSDIVEQENYVFGNDIYLTIDIELQKYVEEILAIQLEAIRQNKVAKTNDYYRAGGGSVVVLDAKTGEVLAMASYPTFDPQVFIGGISSINWNELNDPSMKFPLNNRAIMGFPPGSVFKIAPAYAGLSEGVINKNSIIFCAGTWYGLGTDYSKTCWNKGGHGGLNIIGGIQNSCDIFFYETGLRLFLKNKNSDELLQKYAKILGFGSKTGIDLPNEDTGIIPDKAWKKDRFKNDKANSIWFPGDTVNMAIGQGDVLVSPLQLAYAYMTLANRGIQYTPHILKEVRDETGEKVFDFKSEKVNDQELNQDYINIIENGLNLVTAKGTASSAFKPFPVDKIPVAGKTGTAEFSGRQDYAWFASYAPVGNPQYIVTVMLEEAGGGGRNAAPIAEKIYEYLYHIESQEQVHSVDSFGD
ncbi:MAG: penicillin-binding protein 2 [Actinobacteria bacterium]|nr:penicillin-binding protein 2 [Actinomycetota bacterium]